jgi:hypothetical protein
MGERGYDYEYAMTHDTDKMAEGSHRTLFTKVKGKGESLHLLHVGERKGKESAPSH